MFCWPYIKSSKFIRPVTGYCRPYQMNDPHTHGLTNFDLQTCESLVAHPSLHLVQLYLAEQIHEMQNLLDKEVCVTVRRPTVNPNFVPTFMHIVSLCLPEILAFFRAYFRMLFSKVWAQLVPVILHAFYSTVHPLRSWSVSFYKVQCASLKATVHKICFTDCRLHFTFWWIFQHCEEEMFLPIAINFEMQEV